MRHLGYGLWLLIGAAIGLALFQNHASKVDQTVLVGTAIEDIPTSSTMYSFAAGGATWNATEVYRQNAMPLAGSVYLVYLVTGTAQPASGSLTCTLRLNRADTEIVITVPAGGAAGRYTDLDHRVAVSAGDLLGWRCVNAATATAAYARSFSMKYRFD